MDVKAKLIGRAFDYRGLLKKYIALVRRAEGVDFIDTIDDGFLGPEVQFTDEEREELERLASES